MNHITDFEHHYMFHDLKNVAKGSLVSEMKHKSFTQILLITHSLLSTIITPHQPNFYFPEFL